MIDEHFGADATGVLGQLGHEPRVKGGNRRERRAAARELERGGSAEAVADRRET